MQTKIELEEAIDCGEELLTVLSNMYEYFKRSDDFNLMDMIGGKMFSSAFKGSKIAESSRYTTNIESLGQHFNEKTIELKKVTNDEIDINMDGFLNYLNYFSESQIIKWINQGRTRDIMNRTKDFYYVTRDIVEGLSSHLKK